MIGFKQYINELSKETLKSYMNKSHEDHWGKLDKKSQKYSRKLDAAERAEDSAYRKHGKYGDATKKAYNKHYSNADHDADMQNNKKILNRVGGQNLADKKLSGRAKVKAKN